MIITIIISQQETVQFCFQNTEKNRTTIESPKQQQNCKCCRFGLIESAHGR